MHLNCFALLLATSFAKPWPQNQEKANGLEQPQDFDGPQNWEQQPEQGSESFAPEQRQDFNGPQRPNGNEQNREQEDDEAPQLSDDILSYGADTDAGRALKNLVFQTFRVPLGDSKRIIDDAVRRGRTYCLNLSAVLVTLSTEFSKM